MAMDQNISLTVPNMEENTSRFEERVRIIADEVLSVLRELHQEHKNQINSTLIAKKMFNKESVRNVLLDNDLEEIDSQKRVDPLKETVDDVLNRLAELVPDSMMGQLSDITSSDFINYASADPAERLNLAVKIIKEYVFSISGRVSGLEQQPTELYSGAVRFCSQVSSNQLFGFGQAILVDQRVTHSGNNLFVHR